MASLNVPMPDELRCYLDDRVKSGGFSTPSEYVRHLIREDRAREADRKLEALLLEGLDSGPSREMTADDWDDIRKTVYDRVTRKKRDGRKRKPARTAKRKR